MEDRIFRDIRTSTRPPTARLDSVLSAKLGWSLIHVQADHYLPAAHLPYGLLAPPLSKRLRECTLVRPPPGSHAMAGHLHRLLRHHDRNHQ